MKLIYLLKELEISNSTKSYGLTFDGERIEFNSNVQIININDISNNKSLIKLVIISKVLKQLYCTHNQLQTLDVSYNINLKHLYY